MAAAGCTASKVAPSASIHLGGSVADRAGHPVGGAPLLLFKEVDFGEALGGLTVAVATLGVACFFAHGPAVCAHARKATSGPDGGFSFDLIGRDTQGSVGNADNFDLTALLPPGPGSPARVATTVRFRIQQTALAIPTLQAWGAPIEVVRLGVGVNWPPLPAGYGPSPAYLLQFVDDATARVVASETATPPGVPVDTRWLEDRSTRAEVDASTRLPGPGTDFVFTYRSQTAPFQGHASPPSRGAPCFVSTGDQPAVPVSPCRLTDGDLFTPAGAPGDAVYLDLGRPAAVGLVVIRGGSGFGVVESSTDAKSWNPLGNVTGTFSPLKAATTARYVRVRSSSGVNLGNLSEISVWP